MSEPGLQEDLALARAAARLAGEVALARFRGALDVRDKGSPLRPATDADDAAESAVVDLLARERPGDGVLGEEGSDVAAERRWIVDPIDGTVNFVCGIPDWCVAVALEDAGGPRVSAVLDPLRGELFSAARGCGATLGDVPLAVRSGRPLREALVHVYVDSVHAETPGVAAMLGTLGQACGSLRMAGSGSLGLAWAAAGRLDAAVLPDPPPWDAVPGGLLVAEAGGAVETVRGGATPWHAAAPAPLLAELRALLGAAGA